MNDQGSWAEHSDGPGVTTLLTSETPILKPVIKRDANLGKLLRIGRHRTRTAKKR